MLSALLLALAAIAGATVLTYLYDHAAPLWTRLCAGVCLGFSALGLVGFVSASLLGMTPAALALSGAVCALPLVLLLRADWRARLAADAGGAGRFLRRALALGRGGEAGTLAFYLVAALVSWLVFASAMYQTPEGIFTGVDTNIGDLPFHLAVVTGFAYGENFPPQHPEFAGVRLTYPFIADFVTAMFVRAGAGLEGSMFWQNFAMMMSLVGLLHRWALRLVRARGAALLVPVLVLLSGGFGWATFLGEVWRGGRGLFEMLGSLEHDYTIMGHVGYRWGNAVTALLVTQRGILLGLSLALVVWTLWWEACGEGKGQRAKERSEEAESPSAEDEGRGVGKKKGSKGKAARGRVVKGEAVRAASARGTSARSVAAQGAADADSDDFTFASCLLPFAFKPMLAAGVVAGLLPLVHAHSFVVMMLMGACLALMQGAGVLLKAREAGGVEADTDAPAWARVWAVWRPWVAFACAASLLAVPQMLWATRESGARAGQFFGWEFGWDHGTSNVAWFWLKNTAVFIPLLVVAVVWWARGRSAARGAEDDSRRQGRARRGRRESRAGGGPLLTDRLLFFYAPFVLCFVVPNVYKLSPWVWDNIKVLFYWWVASAPLVAAVLARLWRRGGVWWRAAAAGLLLTQTAAGGLDVWRAASGAVERREFDAAGVRFAEIIRRETNPRSLILHAPTYNDPVYLTGRRSFLGYPGHVWSHGIDYTAREAALKRIYAGTGEAPALVEREGIEYVVVGPLEREEMAKSGGAVNESFFTNRYGKVGESGGYRLYKTRP